MNKLVRKIKIIDKKQSFFFELLEVVTDLTI